MLFDVDKFRFGNNLSPLIEILNFLIKSTCIAGTIYCIIMNSIILKISTLYSSYTNIVAL